MLLRLFVGLSMDASVRDVTVLTRNRARLLAGGIAVAFLRSGMGDPAARRRLPSGHFPLDPRPPTRPARPNVRPPG